MTPRRPAGGLRRPRPERYLPIGKVVVRRPAMSSRGRRNLDERRRDQDKRGAASDLLAPIYNWFTEGLDTPVLQGAKALLESLR